jgi:hypothetical protein
MEAEVGDLIKHFYLHDLAYIADRAGDSFFVIQRFDKTQTDFYNFSDLCRNWRLAKVSGNRRITNGNR